MQRGRFLGILKILSVGLASLLLSGAAGVSGAPDGGITVSPTTLSFGTVPLNTTTPAQVVTVTNTGTTDITFNSITPSGDYAKSGNCPKKPAVLSAGSSCTMNIKFTPTANGIRSGTLTFNDTDPTSPQVVSLTGNGLGPGIIGGPLAGLTTDQNNAFNTGFAYFNVKWDPTKGLGPVFTQAGCFTCHGSGISAPMGVSGDASTVTGTRYGKWDDPPNDTIFDYLDGKDTYAPLQKDEGGPIVHGISVSSISGRIHNCNAVAEVVPPDATVVGILRSPALFGDGLIDSIPESTILQRSGVDQGMGVMGYANWVPDQNGVLHVGRFGQKGQFPNLLHFTLGAMFNELGITDPVKTSFQDFTVNHNPGGMPFTQGCNPDAGNPIEDIMNGVQGINSVQMYQFEALLAPVPTSGSGNIKSMQTGKSAFETVGCPLCHVESMQTDPAATVYTSWDQSTNMGVVASLANQTVNLYSDLLIHTMSAQLAGGIPTLEGVSCDPLSVVPPTIACLQQWRTAPLWGLSHRRKFGLLHDLRTTDLDTAIRAHGDQPGDGEAWQVIQAYEALSPGDQKNLWSFLGSL